MQKASEGFRWQELSLFLATLNWVLCEPHQDKASEMFRGNVLKWSPSKLSLNLGHLMLVPLSHFFSVWQCPMLSRDNSRKHDSIILSRSFFSAWVTSRAPSDQEVIRDLVPDPNPELEEEEVSRLFRESLDIQGHGSRYYHHSDREAFLATQAHGHGSQQHSLKLKKLLNFFCKRNCSDYFMRSPLGPAQSPDVSGCDQAASPSQTETRRGVSPVRGPHSGHGLPSFGRFAERVLPSLPHIATLTTRAPSTIPSLSRPADASPGLSRQSWPPRQDSIIKWLVMQISWIVKSTFIFLPLCVSVCWVVCVWCKLSVVCEAWPWPLQCTCPLSAPALSRPARAQSHWTELFVLSSNSGTEKSEGGSVTLC